ncbi:carboxylesterase family protein [Sinomonas sp. B1-1]|uniref:carboxylesterase family protein n=1 Tax=Sinomonas sp. B1-1 TaxID=3141454 RepID=UPI003D2B34AA
MSVALGGHAKEAGDGRTTRGVVVTRCRWARLGGPAGDGVLPPAVPVAPAAVGTVEDAVVFPQQPGGLDWLLGPAAGEPRQDEDAFQISVYAPAEAAPGAPLVVFLPGGGYVSGGASVRWHDASALAEAIGAVIAVPAYRLGAAACFIPGPDGTAPAVADAVAAVQWAIDHAAHFGGDPDDVTLAGQSAGAWLAFAAAQHPALAGRIRRLAFYSLPYQPPPGPEGAAARRRVFAEALAGADPSAATPGVLVAASAEVNRAWAGRGLGVQPLPGGRLSGDVQDWDAAVGRLAGVEQVLLATTAHEARAFIPPHAAGSLPSAAADAYRAAHFARPGELPAAEGAWGQMTADMTEHQFASAARELAGRLRSAGVAVHVSRLDVEAAGGAGAPHCFDVPFLFGDRGQWRDSPMLADLTDEAFDAVAAVWRDPLARAVAGEAPITAPGEVQAVGFADGVVHVDHVPDPARGEPVRRAEP